MSVKNIVENELRRTEAAINNPDIEQLAKSLRDQKLISDTTRLGAQLGSVAAGFKATTTAIDDVVPSVPSSIPQNVTDKLVIAEMTEKVPGMVSRLKQPVGSSASDLEMITGSSTAAAPAMLDVVIALPTPEATAAAVKQVVPNASVSELQTIASGTVDLTKRIGVDTFQEGYDFDLNADGIQDALNKSIAAVTKTAGGLGLLKSQLVSAINLGTTKALGQLAKGFGSLIENAIEKVLSPASNSINSVATINGVKQSVPEKEVTRIITFVTNSDYDNALKVVRKYSDRPDSEIINMLRGINNTLSSATNRSTPGVPVNAKDLEGIKNSWTSADALKQTFELIDSKEEMIADLRAAKREITEVVVHNTYTGTNINIRAEDINALTIRDYGLGIPYHYVINRDGSIQRGRPISIEMDQLLPNNHQLRSIQICFVGGLSVPEGGFNLPDYKKYVSKTSYTREQWIAFDMFINAAYTVFPYLQTLGHNSIDPENLDPAFDPAEYVESKFGKKLVFDDPKTQPPFTRDALIKRFL